MKVKLLLTALISFISLYSSAQNGWTQCSTPIFNNRVDDIFMVDTQTGYAVCGDGQIVKTTDGGDNWFLLLQDTSIYYRSVEFINTQKGFVGGFPGHTTTNNILRETIDGGTTWTDLSPHLDSKARKGICGLAVADTNTIYGCGNWYQDSAYIVKSSDGGVTWNFIDMSSYAASLIDMYFLNKDTGFATGRGPLPLQTAVILYTTDGGLNWTYKFQNTIFHEYCWKIQHLTNQIYFASIQDFTNTDAKILKSIDGGMSWSIQIVLPAGDNIEGVGFIDSLKGWTGGGFSFSYETTDGGNSWTASHTLIGLNRLFKVNDTLLFASGDAIWKYTGSTTGISPLEQNARIYSTVKCYPNPANENLTIIATLTKSTHLLLLLLDEIGKEIEVIDNTDRQKGIYNYNLNTKNLKAGVYHLVLRTHQDKQETKVIVSH